MQGTTTNGDYLLPFKTGAFLAGAPVQPVVLKYGKASLSWPKHCCCTLDHGMLLSTDTVVQCRVACRLHGRASQPLVTCF